MTDMHTLANGSKCQRDDEETSFPILGARDTRQVVLLGDLGRAGKATRKAAKLKGRGKTARKLNCTCF